MRMSRRRLFTCLLTASGIFQNQWSSHAFSHHSNALQLQKGLRKSHHQKLHMSRQFDVSKPVFDIFSLRSVRGDALTKYNSLNQSEPLRINLSLLFALTFLAAPYLAEELNGVALSLPQVGVSLLGSILCGGLFYQNCNRRSKQLTRMEKELNALSLQVCLPASRFSDSPYLNAQPLKDLMNRSSRTIRILAVSGTSEQLKESLLPLRALGRRLVQASAYVVAIPTDDSRPQDWGLEKRLPWMANPYDLDQWRNYFGGISKEDDKLSGEFRWFGLSAIGRSFGSGKGVYPEWLQLLGQHLRPTEILDASDPSQEDVDGVLAQQRRFYKSLTEGNLEDMKTLYNTEPASKVTNVLNEGGRMDEWKICLEEGARPAGMKVADGDAVVVSDTIAYSTIIEFPVAGGVGDAILLAVQTWGRSSSKEEWKLQLHQTIPWTQERPASGTLLCDCRGCVALTRGPDRRTFGGIIG